MNKSGRSNPGVARSLGGLVLAAAILLTGCSSSDPADAGASPSSSTSTPSAAAPAEATPGIAGQDWVIVDFPYADGEETTVLDIEAGAGALWVVVGAPWKSIDGHKPASEIAVYRSTDAVEWEEVDILELGVPADALSPVLLVGTPDEIVIGVSNAPGILTEGEQPTPYLLRGDGQTWSLVGPDTFGPWQLSDDGGDMFGYGGIQHLGLNQMALRDGTLAALPSASWWRPFATGSSHLGSVVARADGTAALWAANTEPLGGDSHLVTGLLATADGFVAVGTSSLHGDTPFTVWRSPDGSEWSLERPEVAGLENHVYLKDAVIGPSGMVVLGVSTPEAHATTTSIDTVLFSEDGHAWQAIPLADTVRGVSLAVATEQGYYLLGDRRRDGNVVWFSSDGRSWEPLAEPLPTFTGNSWIAAALPNGIALAGSNWLAFTGSIPPLGLDSP